MSWTAVAGLVVTLSCGQMAGGALDAGTPSDGGAAAEVDGGLAGLPCTVATLLRTRCVSCHRQPLAGGATMPLLSHADLTAPSPLGGTQASRSLARMKDTGAPMPPSGVPPAAEVTAFEAWVNAGAPMGACTPTPDGGAVTPTCTSTRTWPETDRYQGSVDMNPGLACRSCHVGQNFNGQNPQGWSKPERDYWFAGTAYPSLNERDLCNGGAPAGLTVEISDRMGLVGTTMPVSTRSGNFFDSTIRTMPTWLPYTVKVKRGGVVVSEMRTPQMSGDCNTCHTVAGAQGAPGRVTY